MTDQTSARLTLPYLMPAQAQKHVTVNEALRRLDGLVQASAASRTQTAPPVDPEPGTGLILPEGLSAGDWPGLAAGDLAVFQDGAWARFSPKAGWVAWVEDEQGLVVFDGSDWRSLGESLAQLSNLDRLGVGTEADAANPFAAKLNAALWTALETEAGGTGDLRYVMNKQAEANTVSLLFQSGFSGRAEIGLAGDDDLAVKVSADGQDWTEALSVGRTDGAVRIPALSALNGAALGGLRNRLINGDFSVHQRGGASAGPYAVDRWLRVQTGGVGHTFTQEAFAPGQDDIPGAPGHFLRWALDAATDAASIEQRIEDVRTLAGQTVTCSFRARASVPVTVQVRLQQYWGSGSPAASFAESGEFDIGSDWTRCVHTLTLPDLSGRTLAPGHYVSVRLTVSASEDAPALDLAEVQLEPGPAATPFERRPAGVELALCRRYLQIKTVRTQDGSRHVPLSPMRAAPSLTLSAGAGAHVTAEGFELSHSEAADCAVVAVAEL